MKKQKTNFFTSLTVFSFFVISGCADSALNSKFAILEQPQGEQEIIDTVAITVLTDIKPEKKVKRKYIRGIHLSAMVSGSENRRRIVANLFDNTELNTAVIDIKEYEGKVYIDGIKTVNANNAYEKAIPDIRKYISDLKEKGIYTIARIVVFRDNTLSRKKPELAVKNPDGTIWTDRKGVAWLDPYNKDTWDYNLEIAEKAVDIGFDEIQFDYIRFPSDGDTKNCCYSKPHSSAEALKALVGFLREANRRLKTKGAKISIDVFGLTTTATNDMGIGQKIVEMTECVDYVSPMVYPSHYGKGNYGIEEPNKEPYKIVYFALKGALKRIPNKKLRPWLQDFSLLGYKYGEDEVKAQMQACYDNKVGSWLLWNPRCVYTKGALKEEGGDNIQSANIMENAETKH
ncbi:putative glycoside hydrolase [Candidatus Endomicrobiellum agilis]|uniref:putative glycoside hydrolase n=1 Tax=Candidatus Endomicrobiellum agilis TaxID=3238957 RepID=UPI003588405E|nr:putative glycoside hydrolase [Endomicrobium sp.]